MITDKQKALHKEVEAARKRLKAAYFEAAKIVKDAEKGVEELQNSCEHIIRQRNEFAVCVVCEKRFGWWCPVSQTHQCDYNMAKPPAKVYGEYCIYCGEPEERK